MRRSYSSEFANSLLLRQNRKKRCLVYFDTEPGSVWRVHASVLETERFSYDAIAERILAKPILGGNRVRHGGGHMSAGSEVNG